MLSALMHGSAAYQGEYARILEGYQVTPGQIQRDRVFLAEDGGKVLGFYSLANIGVEPELDLLFVADAAQGTGVGSALFEHMCNTARDLGIGKIKIVSHPPAERFYIRMGAQTVGAKAPAGKVSWVRPILVLSLVAPDDNSFAPGASSALIQQEHQTMTSKSNSPTQIRDGDNCLVAAGTHAGKAGVVRDIKTSKTGHVTITVVQANGGRFKTLAKNVVVQPGGKA